MTIRRFYFLLTALQMASFGANIDHYNATAMDYIAEYYKPEYETYGIWGLAGLLALPLIGLAIGLCSAFLCRKGACVCWSARTDTPLASPRTVQGNRLSNSSLPTLCTLVP